MKITILKQISKSEKYFNRGITTPETLYVSFRLKFE